mgnify:FL=1
MDDQRERRELTTFQQAELKWLRRQVDTLDQERFRSDARPNVQREIFTAREELDQFVRGLRVSGFLI